MKTINAKSTATVGVFAIVFSSLLLYRTQVATIAVSLFFLFAIVLVMFHQIVTRRVAGILEAEIAERRRTEDELQARMRELEDFNRLSIDRELRMVDLKREVNAFSKELGRGEMYKIDHDVS